MYEDDKEDFMPEDKEMSRPRTGKCHARLDRASMLFNKA